MWDSQTGWCTDILVIRVQGLGSASRAWARDSLRWPEYSVQAMSVPAFSAIACPSALVLRIDSTSAWLWYGQHVLL